jgi:hypothetical protein
MILVATIFTVLITCTVLWMLHGIGQILILQDQKDSEKIDDDFPSAS